MNWSDLILIGEGTTREVYLHPTDSTLVIKRHIHYVGYLQSLTELDIYLGLRSEWKQHFTQIHFVNKEYQICQLQQSITSSVDNNSELYNWDIDTLPFRWIPDGNHGWVFSKYEDDILSYLNSKKVLMDDLFGTSNCGVGADGQLVFIDYGMTTDIFESFILAQSIGEIKSYIFETCPYCNEEKHVIYYGDENHGCSDCAIRKLE